MVGDDNWGGYSHLNFFCRWMTDHPRDILVKFLDTLMLFSLWIKDQ